MKSPAPHSKPQRHAIAAMSFDIGSAGGAVQLLPAGAFRASDDRPEGIASWHLNAAQATAVIARARQRKNQFVIDYEHQTQQAEENGRPAPAAGWFSADALEFREGQGLFIRSVEWTARAADYIATKEYRYVSAVFGYDKVTGDVLFLLCAALTNLPGIDGMSELALAALSARFFKADTDPAPSLVGNPPEQTEMNPLLKALLAGLGLAETATEQEAVAALTLIKTHAAQIDGLNTQVAALKSATPDAARFVPIEKFNELNTQLVQLKGADVDRQVEDVIAKAKAEGKLVPAAESVWRAVGKADIAQLKSLVDATPANPALAGQSQTGGTAPAGDKTGDQLDAAQLAICKTMGLTPEQFKAAALAAA